MHAERQAPCGKKVDNEYLRSLSDLYYIYTRIWSYLETRSAPQLQKNNSNISHVQHRKPDRPRTRAAAAGGVRTGSRWHVLHTRADVA